MKVMDVSDVFLNLPVHSHDGWWHQLQI